MTMGSASLSRGVRPSLETVGNMTSMFGIQAKASDFSPRRRFDQAFFLVMVAGQPPATSIKQTPMSYLPPMTLIRKSLLTLLLVASAWGADPEELQSRRQRAAATCPDGILLVHACSAPDEEADGFRQDPAFYYFTGLENTVGAILAIDGRSRESWLFLPTRAPHWKILPPEGSPDSAAVRKAGIQHWSKRENLAAFDVHTLSPNEGLAQEPFRAGTAIAFEPQASIKGQSFYLEDNYVITRTGTELLSPGLPYTADEIEDVMRSRARK